MPRLRRGHPSKVRPAASQSSKAPISTAIPWRRAISAIPGASSTPSTLAPRSAIGLAAIPVPQPTSSTSRPDGSGPSNASITTSGYLVRHRSKRSASCSNNLERSKARRLRLSPAATDTSRSQYWSGAGADAAEVPSLPSTTLSSSLSKRSPDDVGRAKTDPNPAAAFPREITTEEDVLSRRVRTPRALFGDRRSVGGCRTSQPKDEIRDAAHAPDRHVGPGPGRAATDVGGGVAAGFRAVDPYLTGVAGVAQAASVRCSVTRCWCGRRRGVEQDVAALARSCGL